MKINILFLFLFFSIGSFAQQKFHPIANPASVVTSGNVRFTVLTLDLIRLVWDSIAKFDYHAPLSAIITNTEHTATRLGYNSKTIIEELKQFDAALKHIPSALNSMNLKQNVKYQFLNYLK